MQQIIPFAPLDNIGANSQNPTIVVNLDNIRVTRNLDDEFTPQRFIALIGEICGQFHMEYGIDWDSQREKKPYLYHHFAKAANGIMFWWSELDPETGEGKCKIEFTGNSLRETDIYDEILIVTGLLNRGFRLTRLDPNFDDYGGGLDPNWLLHAGEQGWIAGNPRVKPDFAMNRSGWTVYVGSPNSDRMLRYYNKAVESDGETNAYRFEVQLSGDHAREMGEKIKAMGTRILRKKIDRQIVCEMMAFDLVNYMTGKFRFVIPKEGDKNKSRGDIPEFWKDYCDYLDAIPVYVKIKRAKVPLEKQQRWFNKSTPRYLAKCVEIYGVEQVIADVINLAEYGKSRFTGFDKAEIRQQKKQYKPPETFTRWAS